MRVFFSHLILMYCDNHNSIQIAHNLVFREQTRHIEIDCYIICHHLKHGTITLPFVSSSSQIVDFFTKLHSISHFSSSTWQTLYTCNCRIVNLRGDVKKYRVILFYYLLRVE
jgi:hypothetical protein